MNNQMLDVLNVNTWTDKDGKEQKSFIRCGVAFPRKNEKGYVLKLDVQNMTGIIFFPKKRKRRNYKKKVMASLLGEASLLI